jgi:D-alanyl-lipoteichoic acid acyltransferase DltB (MBOAT superfamily)
MVLSSAAFFIFLGAIYLAYWLVSRFRLAGMAVILFANYYFYARWDLAYLAIIPLASSCDFGIGYLLGKWKSSGGRRLLVSISLLLNLGLIVSVKYLPFFLGSRGPWSWVMPLGLSFYAFQALTYTIDIYRRDAKPVTSYLAYMTSVSFFPTVLAGPITRVSSLVPQMLRQGRLNPEDGGRALFLIGMGLMKKLLIADYLAENLVNRVFDLPKLYSSGEVLMASYGYAFQLYYDFSGYTDIAIGSALLLGFKLPKNFDQPYTAQNISEFWRKWHITFSNWLRDYLYFSLPGARSKWMPYLNLVITMVLGGLWHGANWTFVVWGLLHGVGQAIFRGFRALRGATFEPSETLFARTFRVLLTFHFVTLTWIFFRAADVKTAGDILSELGVGSWTFANVTPNFAGVLALAAVGHFLPKRWYERTLEFFADWPFFVQAGAMAALVLAIQYAGGSGSAPFIYTKF